MHQQKRGLARMEMTLNVAKKRTPSRRRKFTAKMIYGQRSCFAQLRLS